MALRIVGGRHRGRPLAAPPDASIRPTGERTREAVFDILLHGAPAAHVEVAGARVLDAFAGTGAMGLEALSRGAAEATFIERDRGALQVLRANVARLGEPDRARIIAGDATVPPRAAAPVDLAFLDPPYRSDVAAAALAALDAAGWFASGAIAVVESAMRGGFAPPPGFETIDERRYGKAAVTFLLRR
ncbi:MAG: 16S rRNA (guanine(966)-N(2))-methyltransferase RsmD [Alphaproteobacteria bacterium]